MMVLWFLMHPVLCFACLLAFFHKTKQAKEKKSAADEEEEQQFLKTLFENSFFKTMTTTTTTKTTTRVRGREFGSEIRDPLVLRSLFVVHFSSLSFLCNLQFPKVIERMSGASERTKDSAFFPIKFYFFSVTFCWALVFFFIVLNFQDRLHSQRKKGKLLMAFRSCVRFALLLIQARDLQQLTTTTTASEA